MPDYLIPTILSLPFVVIFLVISGVISGIGITNNKSWLVFIGTIFIIPFCFYLNGTRMFYGFGLLLPIFHVASAWAVIEESDLWAWLFLAPTTFIAMWLLVISLIADFV